METASPKRMITENLILNLLLILVVAWLFGSIFARFGLPVMLGELLAGLILGPPLLNLVTPSPALELLADLGIFFVMFYTGVELDPKELINHIWPSLAAAVGGFALPFVLGYFTTRYFGGTLFQSLIIGLGVSITAIAVQSVVLHALRIHKTDIGHVIIGAAIAEDIFSLIGLSVLTGLARSGSIEFGQVALVILRVIGFFALTLFLGHFVLPKFTHKLHDRDGKAFTFAMAVALLMAYLAELAGLHIIIGAFLAGQFVRKEIMEDRIFNVINDRFYGLSYGFLVPIFFVSLSFHLQFSSEPEFIIFSIVLILVAIIGKFAGSGIGVYFFRKNIWESIIVGFGMNGRGAVELVIATVFMQLSQDLIKEGVIAEPLLTEFQFSALILMAFVTTLMAPITLKWSVTKACNMNEKASFCRKWEHSAKG